MQAASPNVVAHAAQQPCAHSAQHGTARSSAPSRKSSSAVLSSLLSHSSSNMAAEPSSARRPLPPPSSHHAAPGGRRQDAPCAWYGNDGAVEGRQLHATLAICVDASRHTAALNALHPPTTCRQLPGKAHRLSCCRGAPPGLMTGMPLLAPALSPWRRAGRQRRSADGRSHPPPARRLRALRPMRTA